MKNKFLFIITVLLCVYIPTGIAPRLDGLNILENSAIIEFDTGSPSFTVFNVSRNGLRANNTFFNNASLNFTYNASDKNNHSVLFYINGVKNITAGYRSNQSINSTITFSDGNYTVLIEINDSAGNKINSTSINVVIDTIAPVFSTAINRTTANSTNILPTTDVNLSVFGFGDIYADIGNFSHNISNGTWYNTTSFNQGNGTYHAIINKNNLTAGAVIGWKFYAYDLAGNELDPIYTFMVGSSPAVSSGGAGSGGFSSPAERIAFESSFMNKELCLQSASFDWFEDTCYNCDGKIIRRDEQLLCVNCIEGYELVGEECKAINPQESNIVKKAREMLLIDQYLDKFFPTNPLLGLIIIGLGLGVGIYGVMKREVLIKRFKND